MHFPIVSVLLLVSTVAGTSDFPVDGNSQSKRIPFLDLSGVTEFYSDEKRPGIRRMPPAQNKGSSMSSFFARRGHIATEQPSDTLSENLRAPPPSPEDSEDETAMEVVQDELNSLRLTGEMSKAPAKSTNSC